MQPLSILFGAGFTLAVSYSLGAVLLNRSCSDPAIRFVTGSALWSALVFTAGALDLFYPATFLAAGAGAILAARSHWTRPRFGKLSRVWLIFLPFLVLYLANAMAPEISYDGSRYHLGLVARFLREHGLHPDRDSMYAAFPQGIEMLYLSAFAFGRHSAASVVHLAFLVALAWQVFTWARREGREAAGVCAALLVFASPIMGVDASSALIDVAVAAVAFTLWRVLESWDETRSPRLLAAAGLLAGFAMAGKYTAFVAVPFAAGYVLWRSRRLGPTLAVAVLALAVVAPWLVRNWLWFDNPTAPFFNQYFPNKYFTASFEAQYRKGLILPGLSGWSVVPLDLTVHGYSGGLFGPVFLLSPLVLLALRWREGRRLLAAAAIFSLGFFWNTGARFLIPMLSFVALALCLVLARYPRTLWSVVGLHALLSWPPILRRYCRDDAWRLDKVTYREALRIKPEEGFLESNLPYYGVARLLDRVTPPDAVIFTEVPIPDAYTSRRVLVGYQAAANIVSRRVWYTGFVAEHAPRGRTTFRFAPRTATAIRIVQTGAGPENWTVHEVRAFDGDRELARSAWRATAHPFPWGAEAALDGRLTSFWMCGDTLGPGEWIGFSFPAPQRLDRVVVESALDTPSGHFALEGQASDGTWSRVGDAPDFEQVDAPADLRRQAAADLRDRGVGYLLAFDGAFGSDDLRARTSDWGITQIAEYKGARLYKLP